MAADRDSTIIERLDAVIGLLQHLLALELKREGVPQQAIAKHIGIANAAVGKLLKGVKNNGK
jgi:predicted transcriptional regulator